MARRSWVIVGLLASGLVLGCAKDNEELTEKRQEAAGAVKEYVYAQKAEFIFRMNRELDALQDELDRLSGRVERSTGAAKVEAKAKLESVRVKWDRAKMKLDQAEKTSSSAWSDMKESFKQSYRELNDSFDETRRWLSDKIEPD